jgi:hypothetical protein
MRGSTQYSRRLHLRTCCPLAWGLVDARISLEGTAGCGLARSCAVEVVLHCGRPRDYLHGECLNPAAHPVSAYPEAHRPSRSCLGASAAPLGMPDRKYEVTRLRARLQPALKLDGQAPGCPRGNGSVPSGTSHSRGSRCTRCCETFTLRSDAVLERAFRDIRDQSVRLRAQCCFPSARERAGGTLRVVTDAADAALSIFLESRPRESLATKLIGVPLHRPCEVQRDSSGYAALRSVHESASRFALAALLSFDFVGLLTHPLLEHFDAVFTE